jgi:hypothetical protein
MVRESRRFSDESWQESRGDPMACGYGAGAGTSVVNAGFNRDSREGDVSVWRDEDETWADVHAPLPDVRQLVQQRNMSHTGSALSTPNRQTIPESQSPVLASGSGRTSVSVSNMSMFGAPQDNTASYSAGSCSPASVAPSTDASRLRASSGGAPAVASSNMSRARGRITGVDKAASESMNVIILRAVLQDNSMVGGFLGWGSGKNSKFMNQSETLSTLMSCLVKSTNPLVLQLKQSVNQQQLKEL